MVSNKRVSSTPLPPIQQPPPQTPQNRLIIPNRSYHFFWYRARFALLSSLAYHSQVPPHSAFATQQKEISKQNGIVRRVTVTCDVDRQKLSLPTPVDSRPMRNTDRSYASHSQNKSCRSSFMFSFIAFLCGDDPRIYTELKTQPVAFISLRHLVGSFRDSVDRYFVADNSPRKQIMRVAHLRFIA